MKSIHGNIRQIGNAQDGVIPRPVLAQAGLHAKEGAEKTPARTVRIGWGEAARKIAEAGDDALVMGEFGSERDADLAW